MFVDLNSVGVRSVVMPCSMPPPQPTVLEGIGMPTPAAALAATAAEAETVQATAAAAAAGKAAPGEVDSAAEPEQEETGAVDCQPAADAEAENMPLAPTAEGSEETEILPATANAGVVTAEQMVCNGPGLQEFSQLCTLDLSDNRLSCVAGLAWLPALQQLILSANRLRDLQGLAQVLGSSCAASDPAELHEQQAADVQSCEEPNAAVSQCSGLERQLCCPAGLSCLRLLDVSFNIIPAEHLLGVDSPLARLPR
jgi:Leucine-rich repeat (LRR) protein